MAQDLVLVEGHDAVPLVTLNRPDQLNALSNDLLSELVAGLEALDHDKSVRAIVVTGGQRVFAAGADLKQLQEQVSGPLVPLEFLSARFALWDRLRGVRTPLIAAVSGYALGAGCELALACDLIVASETARFGQPEVSLGLIPGAGGTQRLARAVGKARALELVLTGRLLNGYEAQQLGLVNRVVPVELLEEEALSLARDIAARPPLSVQLAKEAVLRAFETGLDAGLAYERQLLSVLLGTADAREGISAFLEKRPPTYHGR